MLYIFLAVTALTFAIIHSTSRSSNNHIWMNLTFVVLFVIWGLEYYNTVDYRVMLNKYNEVIYGTGGNIELGDIEPLCQLLFYICSPIGNLFYYVLAAIIEIVILRLMVLKYVPQKYFWVLVLLMLFQFEYVVPIMTLKRQILAVFVGLLVIYVLNEKVKWSVTKRLIVALLICFAAFNIHKATVVVVLFIPIWFLSKFKFNNIALLALCGLYVFQYFFDLGAYASFFFDILNSSDAKYAHYALQFEDENRTTSAIHIVIEVFTFLLTLYGLKVCNQKEKTILLAGIVYFLCVNFFVRDSGRILLPFRICQLLSIPIILSKIGKIHELLPKAVVAMFLIISIKSTYDVYTNPDKSSMTEGFKSFSLIYEAPSMQVNHPNLESKKYLPYR